jgi:hypothetical protein
MQLDPMTTRSTRHRGRTRVDRHRADSFRQAPVVVIWQPSCTRFRLGNNAKDHPWHNTPPASTSFRRMLSIDTIARIGSHPAVRVSRCAEYRMLHYSTIRLEYLRDVPLIAKLLG